MTVTLAPVRKALFEAAACRPDPFDLGGGICPTSPLARRLHHTYLAERRAILGGLCVGRGQRGKARNTNRGALTPRQSDVTALCGQRRRLRQFRRWRTGLLEG